MVCQDFAVEDVRTGEVMVTTKIRIPGMIEKNDMKE